MAIDLGTNSSPYEFENMLPLDVLAAVASETLRNEIVSNNDSGKKISSSLKKQIKKSNPTVMTFEDVKSLSMKSLVEKFSEMTSDELTKKYFYKCLLIPQKCTMVFKSFGNEKKAYDKIKSHLLSHLQHLAVECKSNQETTPLIFTPKSPSSCSKLSEKFSKRSVKKQQILLDPASSLKSHKLSKRKNHCLKKITKLHRLNKKSIKVDFKKTLKRKKVSQSHYLEDKTSIIEHLNYKSKDKNIFGTKIEFPAESDAESDMKYSSYNEYLKNTFLSDAFFEEDEPLVYIEEEAGNEVSTVEQEVKQIVLTSWENASLSFLQDHNYFMSEDESKCEKMLHQELTNFSRRSITCFTQKPVIQPQLIIRTPPFPFVHTPLLPEVAEIKEIGLENSACWSTKLDHSNCFDFMCNEKSKLNHETAQSDEQLSDSEEKFADIFYKMTGTNGSVLECVENIYSNKCSSACGMPKNEFPPNENDENLENLQRIEKELALKYIAKLHAKKKKRIPDSLICQICPDKHFTAQATLIHHYRSHAGIKPYICKICSATFTRQHSLNYHMLIHQNLSRFTCEFCGRTFRHPSHYKEHLRRHTGETPYHCTDCNLHFKTRNTFKRHLKTRHGKLLTASGIEDLTVEEYAKLSPKIKFGK